MDLTNLVQELSTQTADTLRAFPWEDRTKYAAWLSQTYHYVRHSTRILAAAASRFPFDDVGEQFHVRFGRHIAEERAHEKLALHDLKVLGEGLQPELGVTQEFYTAQYNYIAQYSPYAVMGYILLLEATGPLCGAELLQRIEAAHGPKCSQFLRLHAADDVEHVSIALQQVASLDYTAKTIVMDNLKTSTSLYATMLHQMMV